MKTITRVLAGFCIGLSILSCESNSISPALPNEYFILSEGTELRYLKEGIATDDVGTIWFEDTVQFTVNGDTLIDNLSYKKMLNEYGFIEKVVRKSGKQYFGRNHELYGGFSREYMFLDESIPVNGSWEYLKQEGHAKTEYVVKNIHDAYTINGTQYKNVIELDANYYTDYNDGQNLELHYSVKHFYAAGIGEIYAFYPYPVSGMYSDIRFSLLSSQIK
jgi:hypothetical protein